MRKLGAVLLAAPVVVGDLLASLARRLPGARLAGAAGIMAIAALLVAVVVPPAPGAAVPGSSPAPVSADLFVPIGTSHDPTEPLTIAFDQPMDRASVTAALSVQPPTPYSVRWDTTGTVATLVPAGHWQTDTLYRLQVDTTARSSSGGALAAPLRTVVLTADGGRADIAATMVAVDDVRLDTSFRIRLSRPTSIAAVRAALRSDPPIAGDLVAEASPNTFRLDPYGSLAPDTDYRLWLEDLVGSDGLPITVVSQASVHTVDAPAIISVRPKDGATKLKRTSPVTVRFSETMDRAATARAVRVTANGKAVATRATWSADGRTLTLQPKQAMPYGAKVKVTVDLGARSAAGAPVAEREVVKATVRPNPAAPYAIPTGAGGAVNGSWSAVESYYLRLMNCTRTGGWVTSTGACSSPGGRNVAPLALNGRISSLVSRPYARLLATRGLCSHFIGGNPGDRLRANGFGGYNWGENIGCRSGNPYSAVLGTHLFYQREKPYNGGHYRNLMNAGFREVGIGVWVASGRVRLVIDFYGG